MSYLSEANFGDGENGSNSLICSVCICVSGHCAEVVRRAPSFTRLRVRMVVVDGIHIGSDLCSKFSQNEQK